MSKGEMKPGESELNPCLGITWETLQHFVPCSCRHTLPHQSLLYKQICESMVTHSSAHDQQQQPWQDNACLCFHPVSWQIYEQIIDVSMLPFQRESSHANIDQGEAVCKNSKPPCRVISPCFWFFLLYQGSFPAGHAFKSSLIVLHLWTYDAMEKRKERVIWSYYSFSSTWLPVIWTQQFVIYLICIWHHT